MRRGVSSKPGSDRQKKAFNDPGSEFNRGLRLEEAEDTPAPELACRLADCFGRGVAASRAVMT